MCLAALSMMPAVAGVARAPAQQPAAADEWRTFSGTWSARGDRRTLPAEDGRDASIVHLSGSVVLTGDAGWRGFLGEAIGYYDGRAVSVGRAVWTDERGDRVFSELKGESLATGRRVVGSITGGTGRYAGIVGDYEFVWQYVAEDGLDVQGRAIDLKGKFRRDPRQ